MIFQLLKELTVNAFVLVKQNLQLLVKGLVSVLKIFPLLFVIQPKIDLTITNMMPQIAIFQMVAVIQVYQVSLILLVYFTLAKELELLS